MNNSREHSKYNEDNEKDISLLALPIGFKEENSNYNKLKLNKII